LLQQDLQTKKTGDEQCWVQRHQTNVSLVRAQSSGTEVGENPKHQVGLQAGEFEENP
jgi:hypothetical protein